MFKSLLVYNVLVDSISLSQTGCAGLRTDRGRTFIDHEKKAKSELYPGSEWIGGKLLEKPLI
jgi:hypothetical protein